MASRISEPFSVIVGQFIGIVDAFVERRHGGGEGDVEIGATGVELGGIHFVEDGDEKRGIECLWNFGDDFVCEEDEANLIAVARIE